MKQPLGSSQVGGGGDLNEMQNRFSMLEGDRKAQYEITQNTIRQNKEILAHCKRENKELRHALAAVQKEGGAVATRDADSQRLIVDTNSLRKQYDEYHAGLIERQREVTVLNDKTRDLLMELQVKGPESAPLNRQTRMLENRLDKAMIKFNEAQSIRKTYEQIVRRLKEERIGFDNQLHAIERTLNAKEKDLEELVLMSHDATHAKEVAKAELAKLDAVLTEERKHRERELVERRAIMQQRVEMAQRMERREKMRKDIQMDERGELGAAEEEKLSKKMYVQGMREATVESKLEDDQEKISSYEEAFRKIKDATGVADVNEVISKFLTQDETHNNLVSMTKEAQARIDALNEEKSQAKTKVEEIKYSGTGSLGSRRIVDEFESHLSEANAKCERNKQKFERIAKILINVKAGVEHLADMLDPVKINAPPITMTDDTVVEVMQFCEQKMMKVLESVSFDESTPMTDAEAHAEFDRQLHDGKVDAPEYNVRIPMTAKRLDDVDDDEDLEEEDQDQVLDRDDVKKNSSIMLDKVNKKTRKKMGGKKKAKA
jgi:hypothetical protein